MGSGRLSSGNPIGGMTPGTPLPHAHAPMARCRRHPPGGRLVTGTSGEMVCVRRPPDLAALRVQLQAVLETGITALAVVLKHSAIFPDHEQAVGALAREMGFKQVHRFGGSVCVCVGGGGVKGVGLRLLT
jgi:N-methylhydantoinase A/oxoprolinase/acetone carboxylase beta subunit